MRLLEDYHKPLSKTRETTATKVPEGEQTRDEVDRATNASYCMGGARKE
jgi:hypothetical protein